MEIWGKTYEHPMYIPLESLVNVVRVMGVSSITIDSHENVTRS
jgi:hypothetical protein